MKQIQNKEFRDFTNRQDLMDKAFDRMFQIILIRDFDSPTKESRFRLDLLKLITPYVCGRKKSNVPEFDVSKMSPEQIETVFKMLEAEGVLKNE